MNGIRIQSLGAALRHRASVALLDQAAVSIASFGTGILLSRAFVGQRREELGLYYLAVTIGILIVEFQNALVCTPLTVTAPTLSPPQRRRFNGSAAIHQLVMSAVITLALLLSAFAIGAPSHKPMLFTCAITAAAIGLRNFARFLNFSLHRPHIACLADWVVTVLQLSGIVLLVHGHHLNAASAVGVIGICSMVGGTLALLLSRQFITLDLAAAWGDFRDNWRLSRWVFASGIIGNVGTSIYPWILDTFSSTLQAAVWGNCNTVSSVGNPVLMGLQNWMAPAVAHAYTERPRHEFQKYVTKLASVFLLILVPMLLALGLFSRPLLEHLYRDFSPNTTWLVLLLAAGSLVQAVGFLFSRGLFSLGRGATDVWTNVIPVVVLVAIGIPLCHRYGAVGGAASLLLAQLLATAIRAVLFWNICGVRTERYESVGRAASLPATLVEAI
jgi:O-antigen/teichoic acid export membrane protein